MLENKSTQHVTVEQLSEAAELPSTAALECCSTTKPFADSGEANNSALRYLVTVGHKVTAPAIIALRDISYVMECVKTGFVEGTDIRALIHTIRNLSSDSPMAKSMKAGLPYFLGSVCERQRSNSTVKYANFAILDIDHVADIEAVKQEAIDKLPFVRWAFRSVRDGVKLVVQFDRPVTKEEDYRSLWQYLAKQAEHALGIKVDSTPDWSRACFFSFDPGLLYNSGFKAVDTQQALREAALVLRISEKVKRKDVEGCNTAQNHESEGQPGATPFHPSTLSPANNSTPSDDYEKARTIVTQLAQMRIDYRDWIKIGMALYAGFGEGGKTLWDLFLDNPHYEETQRDLDHHWRGFRKVHSLTLATLFYMGEFYGAA